MQCKCKRRYKVFEDILCIGDPDMSYIKPENLEKFKCMTGLNGLNIDREEAHNYCQTYGPRMDRN